MSKNTQEPRTQSRPNPPRFRARRPQGQAARRLSLLLDNARREQWANMGEPARPEHPPERFLVNHGDHRTQPTECLGKASPPLPGYDPDEWPRP